MAESIDSNADIIDIRDVIARVEELRGEREPLEAEYNEVNESDDKDSDEAVHDALLAAKEELDDWDSENYAELKSLQDLLESCKGRGGDEQWEGDWYPISLIRDSYFNEAMDEMVEDCYTLPKDLPFWMTITYDYEALKQDYTSVEFNGVTYWVR